MKSRSTKVNKGSLPTNNLDSVRDWALDQFALGGGTIHGVSHWETVRRHGEKLAEQTPGADILVVQLFAYLHDCRRLNESNDPFHGKRAADAAEKIRGTLIHLEDKQFSLLVRACRDHTDGHTTGNPTIGCCWDADRLDLTRVKIRPRRQYLSTEAACKIVRR